MSKRQPLFPADVPALEKLPGLLPDRELARLQKLPQSNPLHLRITPWVGKQRKRLSEYGGKPCVGFGLSAFGYDVRLGCEVRHMRGEADPNNPVPISPFSDPDDVWMPVRKLHKGAGVVIPPHGCVLAQTLEWVRVPEDCGVLVLCKSTWARCFLNLNTTPLEPGWEGKVTLELHNQSPRHLQVFTGHGVGQLWFFRGGVPDLPYNKRANPTYQGQDVPTPSRVGK